MSFKTISITLPEKMIRQIDEVLINNEFSSRSDFFRVLLRMWFLKSDSEVSSGLSKDDQIKVDPEIDLEYGIPQELVNKFAEKAKSLNK